MIVPDAQPSRWNVPYRRNLFFTGREETLSQLYQTLRADNTVALSDPLGISGLGGIGKTQTALEYAYRYCAEYDAVLWIRADSTTALTSSFVDLAHLLELPERNERDQGIIVEAVLRWFRLHTEWLLIFDNVDDLSVVKRFLPEGTGHILFTTRSHALGGIAQCLEVQKMEPEIGALLLLRRAAILPLQAPLDIATRDDRSLAREISQELDGLPLALDQAGAYIKETPCSLRDYLARYQGRRQQLLQARRSLDQDYPASVATTWSLSFEKVNQAYPAAAELLNFCAFLAPDAIPEKFLTAGASHLGTVLAPVVTNQLQLDQVCKEVLRYSLFQRGGDERTLTIHRLVQAVLQDNLPSETCAHWKRQAVLVVNEASPNVQDVAQRDACEQWLPHAQVCAAWIEQEDITLQEAALLLNSAGYYLDERAQYTEAEPLYVRALAIRERQLGAERPYTAHSLNNLAMLYYNQGKYGEAELLYMRALQTYEQHLGIEHPDIARSLNNLALLYDSQGKYAEAESLYVRALAIREQQLGAEHPDTATTLNNLAMLYDTQGKYGEAELLYMRALQISERQLGTEHPYTAQSLNNLALLYYNQGKYAEAEPLYARALSIYEQQLGASHPDVATSLNNLAALYQQQEKYAEAEPLYARALSIYEQQLGTEHPDTVHCLNNLAVLYGKQGNYAQAEPLLARVLQINERQLGAEHLDTAHSLNNLAMLYYSQGKYAQAGPLLERALAIRERQLGVEHLDTVMIRRNYAFLLQKMEQETEVTSLETGHEQP